MIIVAIIFIMIRWEFVKQDNDSPTLVKRLQKKGDLVFTSLIMLSKGLQLISSECKLVTILNVDILQKD